MTEDRNNAYRLIYVLLRYDDDATIRQLAKLLNYDIQQLQNDIASLRILVEN